MIHIEHKGHSIYIGQRITAMNTFRLLRAAGIDPECVEHIWPSDEAEMRNVETVTIDEAIEALR